MKKVWFYDLEVLENIFTATFINKDGDEKKIFVISDIKDERAEFFKFLKEVIGLIGYNVLWYDSQILEYMFKYPNCTNQELRAYSNTIISDNKIRPDVPEWKLKIPHLDLFRALSLSTKSKRTSLKWCEFMIDFENIEDMPESSNEEEVLAYNLNDVLATKALYLKYKYEIELRKTLTQREGISLMNCTEPDLAKRLFGKYLSKEMNITLQELKFMSTDRDIVNIKDIIFPYVQFNTDRFKLVKNSFEKLQLKENDKADFTVKYQGVDINFGLGGIHASVKNSINESDDKYVIKSLDVVSYYPNLAIKNGVCAKHLPKDIFLNLYEGFFNERKSIPKSDPRNYILKILLNAAYGRE